MKKQLLKTIIILQTLSILMGCGKTDKELTLKSLSTKIDDEFLCVEYDFDVPENLRNGPFIMAVATCHDTTTGNTQRIGHSGSISHGKFTGNIKERTGFFKKYKDPFVVFVIEVKNGSNVIYRKAYTVKIEIKSKTKT